MGTGPMPKLKFATDAKARADAVRARRGAASRRAPLTNGSALASGMLPTQTLLIYYDASKHSPATVAGEPKRAERQRKHKGGRTKVRATSLQVPLGRMSANDRPSRGRPSQVPNVAPSYLSRIFAHRRLTSP